ncbi:MAG: peptidase M28, partial [Gemmatimonadaceae bacterium]|nr:peptidase M28 [Gemmatimonadaceae bacterium]
MRHIRSILLAIFLASPVSAQSYPSPDPVLRSLWTDGMENSQLPALAQVLLDSLGPRLTGSPGIKAANDWLVRTYASWGIPARNEQYGTWPEWRRGATHVDLVAPWVRTLEGVLLAWSPGTGGRDVTGPVIALPDLPDSAAYAAWYPQARGKFVLVSFAEPTCRPDDDWLQHAAPGVFDRMDSTRAQDRAAWAARVRRTGFVVASSLG